MDLGGIPDGDTCGAFMEINQGKFAAHISELVLREIGASPADIKRVLLTLMEVIYND